MLLQLPDPDFCRDLFDQGMVTIRSHDMSEGADRAELETILLRIDAEARSEAPGAAPALDIGAAIWSLAALAWAARLMVNRFERDTALPAELAESEPDGKQACHHWSVDLGLRFWADLWRKANAAASADDLGRSMLELVARWPLAAVGTKATWDESKLQVILSNPCLRDMLCDRIVARGDQPRMTQSMIAPMVKARMIFSDSGRK